MSRVLVAVVLVLSLAGCGSTEPGPECVPVPADTVDSIAGGDTHSFEPTGRAGAVRAGDDGYVVAVEAAGRYGDDPVVGVWWTPDVNDPGPIMHLDAMARTLSNWPQGPIPNGHKLIGQARECVSG